MSQQHSHNQGCGPDCRYRQLYEGSQTSLRDMATRQSQVLSRVSDLRNAIVMSLKRSNPRRFAQAEAQMGTRITNTDDSTLIAYLEDFLTAPKGLTGPDPALAALRTALESRGIQLPPGEDLNTWVLALTSQTNSPQATADRLNPPSAPQQEHLVDNSKPAVDMRTWTPSGAGVTPSGAGTPPVSFTPLVPFQYEDEEPLTGEGDLSSIFDEVNFGPGPSHTNSPAESTEPEISDLEDLFTDDLSPTPDWLNDWTPPDTEDEFLAMMEEASSVEEPPTPQEPVADEVKPPQTPVRAAKTPEAFRPTLFGQEETPKRTGRRRPNNRTPRVQATEPAPGGFDAPQDVVTPLTLTSEQRQALLAKCALAKPMFLSDLVSGTTPMPVVEAWQTEMRQVSPAQVKFLNAKSRYPDLGALILPTDELRSGNPDFDNSYWSTVLDSGWRGAHTFELAVLLRKFGDQVVGFEVNEHQATMRVQRNSRLRGVILLTGAEQDQDSPAMAVLKATLTKLSSERLEHVAVLSMDGRDKQIVQRLSTVLGSDPQASSWAVNHPVVVSLAWQYDQPGLVAMLAIGTGE